MNEMKVNDEVKTTKNEKLKELRYEHYHSSALVERNGRGKKSHNLFSSSPYSTTKHD
jgi:hypothetical protein